GGRPSSAPRGRRRVTGQGAEWQCAGDGGRSSAGLRSKNPTGTSVKPAYSTGITGQSSGRAKWVIPNVYQSTTSASASGRSAAVQRGRPSPPALRLGQSPAAR